MSTEKDALLRDRIHEAATLAINSIFGTDDRHAYMGLRIAQAAVDGRPLPWKWNLPDLLAEEATARDLPPAVPDPSRVPSTSEGES